MRKCAVRDMRKDMVNMNGIYKHSVNLAYFYFQNKINEHTPSPDTYAYLTKNGDIDLSLNCSINFGQVFQRMLKENDFYLYLTIFSEDSGIDEKIYLDQIYGKIPNDIGSVSFGAKFPVHIDGKFISRNSIKSLDVELSISPKTDKDTNFNQSVKDGCFFKTILPIWSK